MGTGALSIKLRCASWQQLATIYKRDLSRGTMFLKAAVPPEIGTMVRIDLTLPSASTITLSGVVHQRLDDPARGTGVELKLAPIPAGSIWLIESALASDQRRHPTPPSGVPQLLPPTTSGPVAMVGDGEDMAAAELELIRALMAEVESLKKLNPFLVLGVGYEASDADVRASFGDLTKRYHPDRFMRYESPELRQVAAEIFILIRDAYRRLNGEAGRMQVLGSLGRTPSPRAVPAPRAPAAVVGPPPVSNTRSTGSVPALAPRAIVDQRSGPVRVVSTPPPAVVRKPAEPVPSVIAAQVSSPVPVAAAPPAVPVVTERQSVAASPPPVASDALDPEAVEELVDAGRLDEALAAYKILSKRIPSDRTLRAGVELCEGLRALVHRDRLEAAQRFEAALEIDPSNERAARELADMRRQATHERKGLLSRLMGKREP